MTLNTASRAIIGIAGIGAVVVAVTEPVVPVVWATASPQPAGQASPGANKLSPPFGDHQAQGRGR